MKTRRSVLAGATAMAGLGLSARNAGAVSPIHFEIRQNTPLVRCLINGAELAPFVIDVRGNLHGCSPNLIKTLNLPAKNRLFRAKEFFLGDQLNISGMAMTVLPDWYKERPVSGSIGLRAFHKPVALDWDARTLTLGEPGQISTAGYDVLKPVYPMRRFSNSTVGDIGGAIPTPSMEIPDTSIWPVVMAEIDGVPLRLRLSSWVPYGILVEPRKLNAARYARKRVNRGKGGAPAGTTVVAETLQIGGGVMKAPLVTIGSLNTDIDWRSPVSDGLIGFDVLRRFNLINNEQSQQVWSRPNSQLNDIQMDDRAGMSLYIWRKGTYLVRDIDPAGAAFKAGVRDYDVIVDHHGEGGLSRPGLGHDAGARQDGFDRRRSRRRAARRPDHPRRPDLAAGGLGDGLFHLVALLARDGQRAAVGVETLGQEFGAALGEHGGGVGVIAGPGIVAQQGLLLGQVAPEAAHAFAEAEDQQLGVDAGILLGAEFVEHGLAEHGGRHALAGGGAALLLGPGDQGGMQGYFAGFGLGGRHGVLRRVLGAGRGRPQEQNRRGGDQRRTHCRGLRRGPH